MGLDTLAQGVQRVARHRQLAREAGGRLALGNPTQQQHPRGRSWPRLGQDRPRQQRIVAIAGLTAVGGEISLFAEQAPLGAAAAGACEPSRMQVALEPGQTDTLIQEFAYRKVDHTAMIPHSARWLHMSHAFFDRTFTP